ncbi:hypothetical protein Scep_008256 [Stephania cephalantha]|uniref:Uncharacterized protein n=1 Tax=Stephania cephalantha TaxID=152367 RepID=A0AAP0PNY6_9MAGN
MTRPTPARAHPLIGAGEEAESGAEGDGEEHEIEVPVSRRRGPCGGGRSGGTLGEGGGEDEAGKRTGEWDWEEGEEEWRRKRDPTVEIWSWRAGRLGRGIGGISREIGALMMKEREMMEVEMERIHERGSDLHEHGVLDRQRDEKCVKWGVLVLFI